MDIVAIVCAIVGALGWGLYLGERQRCRDLRSLLTFGRPAIDATTGIFQPPEEPEDRAARSVPQISEENLDRGADDLIAIAKANGLELSKEDARQQAFEMLSQGYGYNEG